MVTTTKDLNSLTSIPDLSSSDKVFIERSGFGYLNTIADIGSLIENGAGFDPDLILMPDGLSVEQWNHYLNGGFASRSAAVTWWASYGSMVPGGVRFSDGNVEYIVIPVGHTLYGTDPISDLPGAMPFGDAYIDHYGAVASGYGSTDAATNLAAANAALSVHDVVYIGEGAYSFSNKIEVNEGKGIVGISPRETVCVFHGNTVSGFKNCHADPDTLGYVGGLHLSHLSIVMASGDNHTAGNAIHLAESNGARVSNVNFTNTFGGILVEGGQNNKFLWINGYGRPGSVASTNGSYLFQTKAYVRSDLSVSPCYTCFIDGFNFSGNFENSSSTVANTQDIFHLENGDNVDIRNGYCNYAARSLVYIKAQKSNIAQINIDGVYLDGTRFSTLTTPYCIYVDASDGSNYVNMLNIGTQCRLANAQTTGLYVDPGADIKRLKFDGVISGSAGDAADITGSSATDGLNLDGTGCYITANTGAFKVGGARSVVLSGTVNGSSDATGAVQLSGTILQKKLSLSFDDNTADLSDTSTGRTSDPTYEWYDVREFTPQLSFGGGTTGASYSLQEGKAIRVGNRVDFWIVIILTAKPTDTGEARVGALPFDNDFRSVPCVVEATNMAAGVLTSGHFVGDILNGANPTVRFYGSATTGTPDDDIVLLYDTHFNDNTLLKISGTYYTDDF